MSSLTLDPQPQPLAFVYPTDLSGCNNILLIDSAVPDAQLFASSANASTFPITYSTSSTKTELLALLKATFPNTAIERIGLVFTSETKIFLDNKPFYIENEFAGISPYSENVEFIIAMLKEFSVKNIDYLACDTLNSPHWVNYYTLLSRETGVIVGASNDKTGNIKYGGDWLMESTSQDIELIYFTESIEYYTYLLDNPWASLPYTPTFLTIDGSGTFMYVLLQSGTALFPPSTNSSIAKLNISSGSIENSSWYNFPNGAQTLVIDSSDTYMYVANGILITQLNLSDGSVENLNWATISNNSSAMVIDGAYMYVSCGTSITQLNLSDGSPTGNNPWATILNNSVGMIIDSSYMYVATGSQITQLNFPAGTVANPNWATGLNNAADMVIYGAYMYVTNATRITQLNFPAGTVANLNWVTGLNIASGLGIYGPYLYVATSNTQKINKYVLPPRAFNNNAEFTQAIAHWFQTDPVIKQLVIDTYGQMSEWDTINVTDMSNAFQDRVFTDQANTENITGWNTSNVITMASMFINTNFNQAIIPSGAIWGTSLVLDMSNMFNNTIAFNQLLNLDTSSVLNMSSMFENASLFNKAIIPSGAIWDTSKVINMSNMFNNAIAFNKELTWNTSSVLNMSGMFENAIAFDQAIISSGAIWDTSKVLNMSNMFNNAIAFNQLLNLDTSSVLNMSGMFHGATSFDQEIIPSGAIWDTSKVLNMSNMFNNASTFNQALTWNTSSVLNMSSMFENASVFNSILYFDISGVLNMSSMFENASIFNQVLIFNTTSVTNMTNMFIGSAVLLPNNFQTNDTIYNRWVNYSSKALLRSAALMVPATPSPKPYTVLTTITFFERNINQWSDIRYDVTNTIALTVGVSYNSIILVSVKVGSIIVIFRIPAFNSCIEVNLAALELNNISFDPALALGAFNITNIVLPPSEQTTVNLLKTVDSNDYTTYKKRTTIAQEYVNANTVNTLNPKKANGQTYNQNFRFVPTIVNATTDASNCLLQAKNYELKQDYLSGVDYLQVACAKTVCD